MRPEVMTVSQFANYVNGLVSTVPVLVEGEVSNYREIPGRNFCYFDIKDDNAVAKCFQGFWQSPKAKLENGSLIRVYGFPTLQRNGSLVIDIREIQLMGEGALMQAYLKLKEKLQKEGIFDEIHKKELPTFSAKVGLIAGKNSSAYHDVVAELTERWGGADIFFHPSKVQGIYAKKEVRAAIQYFNEKQPVDVLIVARGGGSLEELQAFDSEEVVREIFASKIPVISAIGHEDHWTLCDFVSDARAKTPTKAAQLAVPSRSEIGERLDYFFQRIGLLSNQKTKEAQARLDFLEQGARNVQVLTIERAKSGIEEFFERCNNLMYLAFNGFHEKLDNLQKSLDLINPQRVLERGFAVVEKNGKRVESINDVAVGDVVVTTLQDGSFEGTISHKSGNKSNYHDKLKKR